MDLSTRFAERVSTGFYAPAGVRVHVHVIEPSSGEALKAWSMRIGAHTDDLSNCGELKRWPCLSLIKENLDTTRFSMCSPYGGLIYFESSKQPAHIRLSLSNVVEAPFIDMTKPETVRDWNRRRNVPGLWYIF